MTLGTFFTRYENEIRYENPMIALRKEQLALLNSGTRSEPVLQDIFNTIPKNFRAIYMTYREFDRALQANNSKFVTQLKKCLTYCITEIG